MRSLTVFWVHSPEARDAKIMPVVEYGLSDAFRDFATTPSTCARRSSIRR